MMRMTNDDGDAGEDDGDGDGEKARTLKVSVWIDLCMLVFHQIRW